MKSRSGILAAGGLGLAGVCLCCEGFGVLCAGDSRSQYYLRCALQEQSRKGASVVIPSGYFARQL